MRYLTNTSKTSWVLTVMQQLHCGIFLSQRKIMSTLFSSQNSRAATTTSAWKGLRWRGAQATVCLFPVFGKCMLVRYSQTEVWGTMWRRTWLRWLCKSQCLMQCWNHGFAMCRAVCKARPFIWVFPGLKSSALGRSAVWDSHKKSEWDAAQDVRVLAFIANFGSFETF